jgi:microsomal dipeptidase-like Zn-dependent dipeptidase
VVGDDDQCIYGWRGSEVDYMVHFARDHEETQDFSLSENFRSTPQIISVANSLIAKNQNRLTKHMFTNNPQGTKPIYFSAASENKEAEFIADPFNEQKRQAWQAVQKELLELPRPSYTLIADHIDHVVELVGIDHVGIGTDFDGIDVTPEGLENVSMMPLLFEELRRRGYTDEDIEKIASRNFFNVFSFSDAVRS